MATRPREVTLPLPELLLAAAAVFVAVGGLVLALPGLGRGGLWPGNRLVRLGLADRGYRALGERPGTGAPGPWPLRILRAVRRLVFRRGGTREGPRLDEEDLEESLYALNAALEAGAGLIQAMSMAASQCPASVAAHFSRMVDEFSAGIPLSDCLARARGRAAQASFSAFCDTIDIQRSSGGDLRVGLSSLAEIIRERRDLRQELRVKTAEARQSALVLCLIPPVIALVVWLMKPDLMAPLWLYPTGRLGVAAGIGLWAMGGWLVSRLTRISGLEE